jgi:glyoxylase I family protein
MSEANALEGLTVNDPQIMAQRRANTSIKQLSHSAVRVKDIRETRAFYEDLLGIPLVSSQIADFDPGTNAESNYVHCFFEVADGSMIAFFQFEEGFHGEMYKHTDDAFERHIAFRTDRIEHVDELHERVSAAGFDSFVVDHDWCYSVYMTDPDEDVVEVTFHRPSADVVLDQPALARETLEYWFANPIRNKRLEKSD